MTDEMQEVMGLGQAHGSLLNDFTNQKSVIPFISSELSMELSNPKPKRDNMVDAAGYAETLEMTKSERDKRIDEGEEHY